MSCYIDTSGVLAVVDTDDKNHPAASRAWKELLDSDTELVCSNYVLVETFALLQHRFGLAAVRAFSDEVTPALATVWVDAEVHAAAVAGVLQAGQRKLSLVDCASFEIMRRQGLTRVFCFDSHFAEQGFACIPGE